MSKVAMHRIAPAMKTKKKPKAPFGVLALLCLGACHSVPRTATDAEVLLEMHEGVLEAHRKGDVESWMALEAKEYVSANRGRISFPTIEARRSMRAGYLGSTTFSSYLDLRPPIVQVSRDGTLGWVIVEVEASGQQTEEDGSLAPLHFIFAWIELYEKQSGIWKSVGNVSNQRL